MLNVGGMGTVLLVVRTSHLTSHLLIPFTTTVVACHGQQCGKVFSHCLATGAPEDVKRICSYIVAKLNGNSNTGLFLDVTLGSRPLALEVENWRKYLGGNYDLHQAADEASCIDY